MKPRVKFHKNGTCTISGVPSSLISSIFTAAALRQYEQTKTDLARRVEDAREALSQPELYQGQHNTIQRNLNADKRWYQGIDVVLKLLKDIFSPPYHKPESANLKERLKARAKERQEWNALLAKIRSKMPTSDNP